MRSRQAIQKEIEHFRKNSCVLLRDITTQVLTWAIDKTEKDVHKRLVELASRIRRLKQTEDGSRIKVPELKYEGAALLWFLGDNDLLGFSTCVDSKEYADCF